MRYPFEQFRGAPHRQGLSDSVSTLFPIIRQTATASSPSD